MFHSYNKKRLFPLHNKRKDTQIWFTVYAADAIRTGESVLNYVIRIYDETPFYDYTRFPTIPAQLSSKTLLSYDSFSTVINSILKKGYNFFYITIDSIYIANGSPYDLQKINNRQKINHYTDCFLFTALNAVISEPDIINCDNNHILELRNNIKLLYGSYYK